MVTFYACQVLMVGHWIFVVIVAASYTGTVGPYIESTKVDTIQYNTLALIFVWQLFSITFLPIILQLFCWCVCLISQVFMLYEAYIGSSGLMLCQFQLLGTKAII